MSIIEAELEYLLCCYVMDDWVPNVQLNTWTLLYASLKYGILSLCNNFLRCFPLLSYDMKEEMLVTYFEQ